MSRAVQRAPFSASLAVLDNLIHGIETKSLSAVTAVPASAAPATPAHAAETPAPTAIPQAQATPACTPAESGPVITDDPVCRVDLRVGLITKCWKHPDADSLYCEEIDVGEEKPRTICSGLVKFVPLEKMQNQRCVVVANLKPAKMRGILSQGMVLCASDAEKTKVEFVVPPADAKIGERLQLKGYEIKPDAELNPKKKIWETVQPLLKTDGERQAMYKDIPFHTSAGTLKAETISGGNLS
eukprot:TRINITY_DN1340_c0_g1::TRINITY_DN1340_c0_g1_i1::g.20027::m.20027 TRINITY_DN1340_c0_g1::TRINITY_DN1340_c0_g1_i1::g.20027  ORF type:complete len:252 (+),score=78.05,sp/Q9ZTS1/SYM_ORYSJ/56.71/3e-54,tRNA_bind/PF01588.15/5.5e-32,DUF2360/PF10152.4/0.063 TRINITY_DN1340_c0_g1_i1:36-758(+)